MRESDGPLGEKINGNLVKFTGESASPLTIRWHKIHGSHMQHRRRKLFKRAVKPTKFAQIIKPSVVGET